MVAHSYSMLGNASFRSSWDGASDTVAAMMNHLDVSTTMSVLIRIIHILGNFSILKTALPLAII